MKKKLSLALVLLLTTITLFAQDSNGRYIEPGLGIQQYPTGFLPGLHAGIGLAPHHAMEVRVGYNILDHQDFGVQDEEQGGGFGFSLGYRYYFKSTHQKWFIGARSDLWFNEIDWKDNIDDLTELNGTTNVTVFQPTGVVGYRWGLNDHLAIIPTLALGAEINIKTEGAEVGQGAIFLWGLNLSYRL